MTALHTPYIYEAIHGEGSEALARVAADVQLALQLLLPGGSYTKHSIREVGEDYFSFDFKVITRHSIKPLAEFSAEFSFSDKGCLIYKISVDEYLQGRGLGRTLLAAVLSSSHREGFVDYDVSTGDAGSYFWASNGFRADPPKDMQTRIHARIGKLEPYLPASLVDRAARLADTLIDEPGNLFVIAGLQHRKLLKEKFSEANGKLPCRFPSHLTPSFGQALLVGTAWDGVARLDDPEQKAQIFGALGLNA